VTGASPEVTLRVGGVPEHFNTPWQIAIESGAASACGADIDWSDYSTGTGAMLADLAANQLDLAVLLTEGAALGLARKLPIAVLQLYTTSPLIWGIHVAPAAAFGAVSDLRGARFAISRYGSGSHLMSLALATDHGWPTTEMRFEVVDNLPGAVAAFGRDAVDVFLWEHFTTAPQVEAGVLRRIDDFVSPWPAWVVCANLVALERHRDAIERLLEIVAESAEQLSRAPDRAAVIAARYGLREQAVREWLSGTHWAPALTPADEALAAANRMLEAAGAIEAG
jgi:sulfonate transport system substrate-binding protein